MIPGTSSYGTMRDTLSSAVYDDLSVHDKHDVRQLSVSEVVPAELVDLHLVWKKNQHSRIIGYDI